MQIASTLTSQCAVMFALMGIGFLLAKKNMLSDGTTRELGAILLNLVLPVVVIRSFWGMFTAERLGSLGFSIIAAAVLLALSIALARAAFPKDAVFEFSAAFSNAGFIGIPLVQATLGQDSVFYIACFIAGLNVLQWTYGKWRLSGKTDSIAPRSMLASPVLIALFAGMALFLFRIPKPQLASSFLDIIAGLNTPFAMIILGTYLAKSNISQLLGSKELYAASVMRLIAIPVACAAFLAPLPLSAEFKLALFIAAAAPVGANVAVFCQQLGRDTVQASNVVCLSTLLSLVTLPFLATCSSYLF